MTFFYSSPIPSRQDMFARNAPELNGVVLCQFLKDLDIGEKEIQDKLPIQPESISEIVIQKLEEARKEINLTALTTAFGCQLFFTIGLYFVSKRELSKRACVLAGSVPSILVGIKEKFSEEHLATRIECNRKNADGRINRLTYKIDRIQTEISKFVIVPGHTNQRLQQLQCAKEFFQRKMRFYENLKEKSPSDLTRKFQAQIYGVEEWDDTYLLDPETGVETLQPGSTHTWYTKTDPTSMFVRKTTYTVT